MFVKFPSIGSLASVVKTAQHMKDIDVEVPPVRYRGKIKLHGTNAGVTIDSEGNVFAQSRSQLLTAGENDNAGFAAWVKENETYWSSCKTDKSLLTIFGEWCGSGIQRGVAISNLNRKIFAVFAAQLDGEVIVNPSYINHLLYGSHEDVFVLPEVNRDCFFVDFSDRETLVNISEKTTALVEKVEACDPWVKNTFEIEGIGEGLVYYPVTMTKTLGIPIDDFRNFVFKAKGEKHRVVKTKKAVEIDVETLATIDAFVGSVVTDARLEQAVDEGASGSFDKKMIGKFLGWICSDIKKDVDNGLTNLPNDVEWKSINQAISKVAREWFIRKADEI